MATILVTAAGGGIGVGAIRSIRAATDHRIVGVDIEPRAGGLYQCDVGYAVPRADDDDWATTIASIVDDESVDVVVPLIDRETVRLEEVRDHTSRDVSFLAARAEVRQIAYDKYRTSRWLAREGFRVPELVTGDCLEELAAGAFPAVVKPRTGQGNSLGSGVERVDSREAAREAIEASRYDLADLVVEAYVDGTEFTTEVLTDRANECIGVVAKEAVSSDPYHRVTREAPQVREECRRMVDTLRPAGVMNVQSIVTDEDVYTFEINPRFSASSALAAAAGLNGFERCIRDALGERVDRDGSYAPDVHLFRHPEYVYVDGDERIAPTTDTSRESTAGAGPTTAGADD